MATLSIESEETLDTALGLLAQCVVRRLLMVDSLSMHRRQAGAGAPYCPGEPRRAVCTWSQPIPPIPGGCPFMEWSNPCEHA
jgi:hypothetical protein